MRPLQTPIGLHLTRSARAVGRAFDDALAEAGGSLPVWLVLLSLKQRPQANQRDVATAMGLTEATLTHHLGSIEAAGLITRRRDPANRRHHILELTGAGEAAFTRLRAAAVAFDRRLRRGTTDDDIDRLRELLDHVTANVAPGHAHSDPTR
ncbi:MAG TPA: MarR family winged helix-turn-helix transcriptional regulator [Candidatus Dormibacteraeota bacterium]